MRKLWMAVAGAVVLSIAVAGIASAVNTYEVDIASTKPAKVKGSAAKPVPAQLKFGYEVGDTENLRPQVVREYRIAAEGLQSFPDARPTCTFDQATDPDVTDPDNISAACKRAKVGFGTIHNEAGAPDNPGVPGNEREQKLACDVQLTLFNISTGDRDREPKTHKQIRKRGGIAIRIDTYEPEGSRCPIPVHEALAAPFYDVKIQGISTAELRFRVPDTLAHPGGLDNAVKDVASTVQKKTGTVKVKGDNRKVGFYSLVGRKGRTRTVRVTFIDESGVKRTAVTQM
jgi:hypothetical protein